MTRVTDNAQSGATAAGPRTDPSLSAMPGGEQILDEYERSMQRILALAASGVDPDLPIPSCPAWNARGIVAHLVGTAAFVASGDPLPEDVQGWIDTEIRVRADRSWSSLADEWLTAYPVLRAALTGQEVGGLIIDAATHEQDLRSAIGPEATAHDLGMPVLLPALIEHVRHSDPFGSGPGVRLLTPTTDVSLGGPEIGLQVEVVDDWELSRLLGCRRSASQLEALSQEGDRALLFALVARYPLPEWPLDV